MAGCPRAPRLRWPGDAGRAVLGLLALLAALLPGRVAHADPGLEVQQAGWDGTVVPGTWSPVRLRITGGSADATGRVEVVLQARYQPGPQANPIEYPIGAYGQDLALPAGVAKELTIWVPVDGNSAGIVRLVLAGETVAEQRVEFKSASDPFWPLIGVLAESPTVARLVGQIERPYQGLPVPVGVARLSPADLPTDAELLNALSALVVQGNAAEGLTGEQRRTIREWTAGGGHLVLAGGPDAARTAGALPAGALPISFAGSDGNADLSALGPWTGTAAPGPGPAARFQASLGATLAGPSDRSLAWRLGLGRGTVTLLAVDPALEPLASWPGAQALVQKALEPALPALDQPEDMKLSYLRQQSANAPMRLQSVLDALPVDAFPDWRTIGLLLGGFGLLVGPLLHLLLRRLDRREWVWLGVPALALLTSGGLYAVGVGAGGRDVLAHAVSYVRLDPASGGGRQALAIGFFAPTHERLVATVPGAAPVRVAGAFGGPLGPSGSVAPPYRVLAGRDTRVEYESGQWGMRAVLFERPLDAGVGRVAARLGLEEGLIKGTVRNDTPFLLEDALVAVGQGLTRIGHLAAGQSAPVVLDPGSSTSPFRGGQPLSYRLFGRPIAGPRPPMPPGVPEPLELPRDPEVLRRARLLDAAVNVPQLAPGPAALPLTFLAFTRAPIGGDLPSAGRHPVHHLTLIEQPLQLELAPGPFTMPAGLIPAEVLEQATPFGMGGGGYAALQWVEVRSGSLVFGFRPPLPTGARAEAIILRTLQVGPAVSFSDGPGRPMPAPPPGPNVAPGPAEDGVFGVYNWQSAAWEPLPGGREQTRLAPAAPYLGPDGLIKVRVSAGADRLVRFIVPELAIEGVVE